jgi:hypothetical protein
VGITAGLQSFRFGDVLVHSHAQALGHVIVGELSDADAFAADSFEVNCDHKRHHHGREGESPTARNFPLRMPPEQNSDLHCRGIEAKASFRTAGGT